MPKQLRSVLRSLAMGVVSLIGKIGGSVVLLIFMQMSGREVDNQTLFWISLLGIIFTVAWIITLAYGRRHYVKEIIDSLNCNDPSSIEDAIESLEEPKEPAACRALLSILRNDKFSNAIKIKVMAILARIGKLPMMHALYQQLKNDDDELRAGAVAALAHLRDLKKKPLAYHMIAKKMRHLFKNDKSPLVRALAGSFFLRYHEKGNLPELLDEFLHDSDPNVRSMAIQSIQNMQLDQADMMLVDMLQDKDAKVRTCASIALWHRDEYRYQIEEAIKKLANDGEIDLESFKEQRAEEKMVSQQGDAKYASLLAKQLADNL